ncbi:MULTISPECIES: hypothetical protein [unclassified Aeromicrobium]|uniref:hypothetical protein n=1 Tax=unclassified Aeromicrobium TaxID=2633570 RepID=UPI00288B61D0|nr:MULTISPECIES: hypothetical protein [unclassified Aeromicrobium]
MTRTSDRNDKGHRIRRRTLGLAATSERATMGKAYENYATAQSLHVQAHNAYMAARRRAGVRGRGALPDWAETDAGIRKALAQASETAMYLHDAKAQYALARRAAELADRNAA